MNVKPVDFGVIFPQSGGLPLPRRAQEALGRSVFGAPSYVYRDEIFWGQDRLEFLERALAK